MDGFVREDKNKNKKKKRRCSLWCGKVCSYRRGFLMPKIKEGFSYQHRKHGHTDTYSTDEIIGKLNLLRLFSFFFLA